MIEEELRATFARHEAEAPPATEVAVAIKEGYRRRRRSRFLAVLAALTVGAVVAVPAVAVGLSHRGSTLPRVNGLLGSAASEPAARPYNLLLLLTDSLRSDDRTRSDTILVVHISASGDRLYLISVPRNTATRGGTVAQNLYDSGGLPLAKQGIAGLFGVASFDAAAVVTYDGLARMVDAIGGVDLRVDRRTTSIDIGYTRDGKIAAPYRVNPSSGRIVAKVPGVTPMVYEVGEHHLAGWQAADYVRQDQLINGDGGSWTEHDQHVRDLAQAMAKQVGPNPVRLNRLMRVNAGQEVSLDAGDTPSTDWLRVLARVREVQDFEYSPSLDSGLAQALSRDDLDAYLAAHPH